MTAAMTLLEYYADRAVQDRLREYCGAAVGRAPTCVYIAGVRTGDGGGATWNAARCVPVHACAQLCALGADVARSMWDRENLIVHLDVDYQNIDVPGEPFHHAAEVFHKI